ncbi:sulfite exporter TauE/SafE family protein [Chitinophaga rhizophila]|uniref:Probable membrane transporter protein n=1 Tax=Chitinophaga rhizophila TaxID=2866212 RepID=A0ABS7GD93_9BACT|nr:sulfite exporter TauE/SafE family protein [Chitinophaga rhizophila]MBW8685643.1 sulfite exporter TauE/SafE family protein [Chitinophaga rhizophila]
MSVELCLLFFTVALLYASAGFGGGSSYLALMTLWNVDFQLMKSTALVCNVVVVAGSVYHFYRAGQLPMKRAFQLSLISIPFAFFGSYLPLKQHTFFLLLGIALTIAAVLMCYKLFIEKQYTPNPDAQMTYKYGIIGGAIGLLSGMTGIGGGIYLSPVLRLGRFDTAKKIAGICALFILVNSIGGLLGQAAKGEIIFDLHFAGPLLLSVILGGQIGARLSAAVLKPRMVEGATALLILYAGVRMLIQG